MMWVLLAFLSAALLGFYDVFKKQSLKDNAVIPVLLLNTIFCSLIFLPAAFTLDAGGWAVQRWIVLKSFIVLGSWLCGYFGIKHLPLTLVGPINATRPVMVLLGALLVFGERLNAWQWAGVALAIVSFFLLSRSGKKEGIDFRHNRWIALIVLAAVLGAVSGLYDKLLMAPVGQGGLGLDRLVVQTYYNFYQAAIMLVMLLVLWWPRRRNTTPFRWNWCIPLISLFLSAADYVYFQALSSDEAMISVVSMIRRSSVLVSFLLGATLFHERNLRSKAIDLLLVLLGMICLFIGSSLSEA